MTADFERFAGKFFPRITRRVRDADGGTTVYVARPPARTRNPDGSVAFVCTGCGSNVAMAIDDGDPFCVCVNCRFYGERPWMDRRGKQATGPQPRAQRRSITAPTLPLIALAAFAALAASLLAFVLTQGGRP